MDNNFYQAQSNQNPIIINDVNTQDSVAKSMWAKAFCWMAMALSISAGMAYVTLSTTTFNFIFASRFGIWGLFIAELILVSVISGMIGKISTALSFFLFLLYSALNGISISVILAAYTTASVTTTFLITAGMFGVMAILGFTLKIDMSKIGSILFMALIGLIIASVVNIFLHSSILYWICTYVGVLLFCGLTVYDVNRFNNLVKSGEMDVNSLDNISLIAALSLYLDFINLFLYLLRIFGNGKN